jgi:transcriptional regulator with XRE-family HTH domain
MSTTDLAASVGDNIRTARKDAGLTQVQLAERVGVTSFMAISRWERGEHKPSDEFLLRLAAALDRDLPWFYTDHREEREAA